MPQSRHHVLWDYFVKVENKMGVCNLCHNSFSFKTSITNLKQHLKIKHKHAYNEMRRALLGESGAGGSTSPQESQEEGEGSSVKFSSEIWRRFDLEDEEARCSICRDLVPTTIEDMKTHLEEHHSQVMDEIIAKAQKGLDSDNDDEEDNLYTEVVYLEDEPKNRSTPKRKERTYYEYTPSKTEKHEKTVKTEKEDDLDAFFNYIRCLFKKVPKDSTNKLQLDIINLLVNAQNPDASRFQNGGMSSRVITLQNLVPDKILVPNLYVAPSSDVMTSLSNTNTINTVSNITDNTQ